MKAKSNIIKILFVSVLTDFLEFTIILPLLPKILTYYGNVNKVEPDPMYLFTMSAVESVRELTGAPNDPKWNSVLFGGITGSMFSLLQFCSSAFCGLVSDRYGRKPTLIISMIGISISYLIWCFSYSLTVFMIARTVSGLVKANLAITMAIISDVTSEAQRNRAMAWIGAAFSLGFILGPMIGAFLSQIGVKLWPNSSVSFFLLPASVSLILSIANTGFIAAFCPETLPKSKRDSRRTTLNDVLNSIVPTRLFRFSALGKTRKSKEISILRSLGLASFFYMIIFTGLEFTITFLVYNRFNWNSLDQGKMFFLMGLSMAVIQGGYVRRIGHGKEIQASIRGVAILIPSFFILAFAQSKIVLWIGLILFSIASSIVVNVINSFASKAGLCSEKGTILGIFRSLQALARAIGPLIASFSYWSIGEKSTYLIGCLLLFCPLLMIIQVERRLK